MPAGWIRMAGSFEPLPEELAEVRQTFGLHELAVEDAQTFHLRPKFERFDQDVQFVILRTARYDDAREEVDLREISIFLGPAFVITVRQGVASELHGARLRLEQHPELRREARRRSCGRSWTRSWTTMRRSSRGSEETSRTSSDGLLGSGRTDGAHLLMRRASDSIGPSIRCWRRSTRSSGDRSLRSTARSCRISATSTTICGSSTRRSRRKGIS